MMDIFYSKNITGNEIVFDADESQHLMKALRKKSGDEIFVTDGIGNLYLTKIIRESHKNVIAEIVELKEHREPGFPEVHIAIAPTKSIERLEWFLEKATELGVSEVTPIVCTRSERTKVRMDRLEKIIIGAMKQSMRLWLPRLNPLTDLKNFLTQNPKPETRNFIAHCQSQNLPSLKSLYHPQNSALILIGPEGDFTLEEIKLAERNGFSGVSLGDSRLRTETAGLAAVHTIRLMK